jgi:prevent-host-death family protein
MSATPAQTPHREISVSEFKAKCLALFDEVAATGETIVITKRGKPIARIQPMEEPPSLIGSVKILVSEEEFIAPFADDWAEWEAEMDAFPDVE